MSMDTPTLISLQVGQRTEYEFTRRNGQVEHWQSAIAKTAVAGTVQVSQTGLAGDEQADTQSHGGIDKAVLAYASAHYDFWRDELPEKAWRHGGFGENLTITGLDETTVCLGDLYRIGEVELEVSQPRQPCWKLCRIWEQPDLAQRVVKNGRSGWYLRVRTPGVITAPIPVELIDRPLPEWPIDRANRLMYGQDPDQAAAEQLANLPQVSLAWREDLISKRLV